MVKKITVWEASDGTHLPSKDEANFYELKLELRNYIDDHPIYGQDAGCRIDGPEFLLWINKHPRIYITLLPKEDVK